MSAKTVKTGNEADQTIQQLLRQALHDLSGPLNNANGFSEELRLVREDTLSLLLQLPEEVSPQLRESLSEQLDTEMNHCLNQVHDSLAQLDQVIQKLRIVNS